MKTFLAILALLVVLGGLGFVVIGRERTWLMLAGNPDRGRYDFGSGRRSPTPNDSLACTEGLCANPDFLIPARRGSADLVLADLAARLRLIDPLAVRVDDRSDPRVARFVTYSPTLRFPDMIHLEAVDLGDGRTGIMAYAAAQLGSRDLGKNRLRLERLFDETGR